MLDFIGDYHDFKNQQSKQILTIEQYQLKGVRECNKW